MKWALGFGVVACVAMSVCGCTAADVDAEGTFEERAAVCSALDATDAAVATLAQTIGSELHHWELTSDFYKYVGAGGQQVLGLSAAGLARCGGSCPLTSSLLALQDPVNDQRVVFGTAALSSSAFANRLTTGFTNQAGCNASGQCPYEPHVLTQQLVTSTGTCDMQLFRYGATNPSGGALTNPANLNNALLWTANNGPNQYIMFQSTALTVSIDPSGGLNPPSPSNNTAVCQIYSVTNISETPCTCAQNNIYSNGRLRNDLPATPRTYYCRDGSSTDVCQKYSTTNLNGTPCTCGDINVYANGVLKNDQPATPRTYYCRDSSDHCQEQDPQLRNLTGTHCTCAQKSITNGQLLPGTHGDSTIYYCTAL